MTVIGGDPQKEHFIKSTRGPPPLPHIDVVTPRRIM